MVVLILNGTLSLLPLLVPDILPNASGLIAENVFFEDFENPGLWQTTTFGDPWSEETIGWEVGTPQAPPIPYSGSNCLGTNLSGNYTYRIETWVKSPRILLSDSIPIVSATLTFWHWYNFSAYSFPGEIDGGWFSIKVNDLWHRVEPEGGYPGSAGTYDDGVYAHRYGLRPAYNGTLSNWQKVTFDLADYIGMWFSIEFYFIGTAGFGIPFGSPDYHDRYVSDSRGWYIDDVSVDILRYDGPTIGPDQTGVGLGGETVSHALTIRNWNNVSDTIDIYYTDTNNWQVRILDASTYLPLQDNGGIPGLPDVFLWAGQQRKIIVNVTIPSYVTDWDVSDLTIVHVVSFVDPTKNNTAELITKTPFPDVGVEIIDVPEVININETVFINVTIKNYGDWKVSFWVEGVLTTNLIIPPFINGSSLQFISDLEPEGWIGNKWHDGKIELQWSFTPTVACEYLFTVTTLLDIDQFIYNNVSTVSIHPRDWKMHWSDDMEDGGDTANGLWNSSLFSGSTTRWVRHKISRYGSVPPYFSMPSPDYCWATDTPGKGHYYEEGTNCYLFTPEASAFDFTGCDGITLSFHHWWQIQPTPDGDWGEVVYTFDSDPITTIYPTGIKFKGETGNWVYEELDMTSFVADEPYVRFGWQLLEDIKGGKFEPDTWRGWYLDDVSVWASSAMPELIITEIVDSGGIEYMEVYNEGRVTADINDYGITLDRGGSWLSSGTWSTPSISRGGYAYYEITVGGDLDDQGETICIVNTSIPEMLINNEVSYGQKGTVPDPIPGESVARYWDNNNYKDEWARDITPTVGSENDGPGEVDFQYVVLNEVLFNPGLQEPFIELRYVGYPGNDPGMDINGWKLVVGDSVFTLPPSAPYNTISTQLDLQSPIYVINVSMFSGLFGSVNINGDNIYLYTDSGLLVDEVGWSNSHIPDTSMARVPDGFGVEKNGKRHGVMGYDDSSSIAAGWQFNQIPSMSVVSIESDQVGKGDLGETVVYELYITNHQNIADYIDLLLSLPGDGWVVELYEDDNATLLADNDGDGFIDTGELSTNQVIKIIVKVTIPSKNSGDFDEIIITAVSSKNPNGWDTALIRTDTHPHIEVDKWANPEEVWLNGTSLLPQETTLTLEIKGAGIPPTKIFYQDVVFCMDSSGSMDWNDVNRYRIDAAKGYVDEMEIPDRGAVVDFDWTAKLVNSLSSDYIQIKKDLDSIDNSESPGSDGQTYIGKALQMAIDELIGNGDPDHTWVIILLSDGEVPEIDVGVAYDEAYRAKDNGIKVYPIAFGQEPNETLLQEIAEISGGKYYRAGPPGTAPRNIGYLKGVYHEIRYETTHYAIDVSLVKDVLPDYIDYVPSSFNVYPDNITSNASGFTTFKWNLDRVLVGDTYTYSFNVVSNEPGYQLTNYVDGSWVGYTKWSGINVTEPFPEVWVYVKPGAPSPPKLFNKVIGNDVQLYWEPPKEKGLHHYLIYKAPSQTAFDFSDVWINTSRHGDEGIIPLRTTWNITGAALDTYSEEQEYYIIRAVNQIGVKSVTSNTVGKWTKLFLPGVSTFSLPLEPFETKTTNWYTTNIPNCNYIRWMHRHSHKWVQHDYDDGSSRDMDMVLGEGYEICINDTAPSNNNFTFVGRPGAHIRYMEGEIPPPANFAISVINGFDVILTWDPVPGADHYIIYKSKTREGFNNLSLLYWWETNYYDPNDTSYIDRDAASVDMFDTMSQCYYMVVAVSEPGLHTGFNGTYSLGVWTEKVYAQYDTMGLPLKPDSIHSTDWYCDAIPDVWGINYYNTQEQRWMWHKTIMPQGAFDVDVVMACGYQVSTIASTIYSFVGI
ncbi:MAG: VWA domain-containing protein [Thermoplasmata archaeon]|nr:MAG: VWA domain-containing protein [Thermoplasmata archaeon]